MDEKHSRLQKTVKDLHTAIKSSTTNKTVVDSATLQHWRATTAQLYKEIGNARRELARVQENNSVVVSILREEMRDELVVREALAARTAERFRSLSSNNTQNNTFDVAARTAARLDSCIGALARETRNYSDGTEMLHRQTL